MAQLRRARGLTQVQLAEELGCSQQQIVSFEKGRSRIQLSSLVAISKTFEVSLDELVGLTAMPRKRGPTSLLEQQLEQVLQLSRSKQRLASKILEGLLESA
jgi:transcriptional regulator with XRE-family HTH domain